MARTDITKKIFNIELEEDVFTPENSDQEYPYFAVYLSYSIKGNPRKMRLKLNEANYSLLDVADDKPSITAGGEADG